MKVFPFSFYLFMFLNQYFFYQSNITDIQRYLFEKCAGKYLFFILILIWGTPKEGPKYMIYFMLIS